MQSNPKIIFSGKNAVVRFVGPLIFESGCPEVATFGGASRTGDLLAQSRGLSPANYGCGTERQ